MRPCPLVQDHSHPGKTITDIKITTYIMQRETAVTKSTSSTWRCGRRFTQGMGRAFALMLACSCATVSAQTAGLLKGGAIELAPLTLSVVEPLADGPYTLESGKYYEIDIVCDGSGELAIEGSSFFRNIWIDEVVINDIEVRPLGLDSLEFDDEGTATIKFVAIRPGSFIVRIPGTSAESQQARFEIR